MNNDFEKHYDCDPADCAGYRSEKATTYDDLSAESASEFDTHRPNELDTESSNELTQTPDEYSDSKNAAEFGTENDTNDFFNAPGVLAPIGNPSFAPFNGRAEKTDISELYGDEDRYDFETSSEFDEYKNERDNGCDRDGCGCGEHCGCGIDGDFVAPDRSSESGADNDFAPDPDDETAATTDHDNSCCGCDSDERSARERCALDDYEIISDVLGSEKQLVKLYSTALCESAEEPLRDVIRGNLIECANDQYKTFEFMEERGLYPTEQAPEEKITQAKQQFCPLCDHD